MGRRIPIESNCRWVLATMFWRGHRTVQRRPARPIPMHLGDRMLRWIAVILLVGAIAVRLWWRRSSFAISIPLNSTTHAAYPLNIIIFWTLLTLGAVAGLIAFLQRVR